MRRWNRILIDPEEGWKYGFPKLAPESFYTPHFELSVWLVQEGYPEHKIPAYVRYIEVENEDA